MRALISAEILPLRHPSSTITARWVLATEARNVASSSGRRVRRSITSASIPSCAKVSAASSALNKLPPQLIRVTSLPTRRTLARSISTGVKLAGKSPSIVQSKVFSKIRTGSGSSNAVHNMPRASSNTAGVTTLIPGM